MVASALVVAVVAAAVAASGGWQWRGRATNAAAAGVECSYFLIETGFCVLLVVGKGQGRQAGS
jgi:hypothetical protein